jgi:putative endonuclease
MGEDRHSFSRRCEDLAEAHLRRLGYRILARNFRSRHGEIDIIARDGSDLVFVEVKGKRSGTLGLPQEMVTRTKMGRLIKTALAYLEDSPRGVGTCRFDVVAVMDKGDSQPGIEHLKAAFGLSGS